MADTNGLSSYRVTDLPQLSDLNNGDLFLITHQKPNGGYESQSIPFRRLMNAVKRRGFRDELSALNEIYTQGARKDELRSEAEARAVGDAAALQSAKEFASGEISKIHSHANLGVLSGITGINVSQWVNDAGYLSAHQDITSLATKDELAEKSGETLAAAEAYADEEISKVHSHANLSVLSAITDFGVSRWTNDAGYLTAHQDLSGYATEDWVKRQRYQKKTVFRDWEA